jgi:CHRD domain
MTRLFTVALTGGQETPPVPTSASGAGLVVFDEDATSAAYQFTLRGVDFASRTPSPADDVVSMHFHSQVRGAAGGVVFGQINPAQDNDDLRIAANADGSWTVSGVWETTDPANASIAGFAGALAAAPIGADVALYFNVHTRAFTAGEIRGQLVAAGVVGDAIRPGPGFSTGFDDAYYLQANPDVAAADVAAAGVQPLLHFLFFGWREGRDINALFDASGYREHYPDVAAAGVDPAFHFTRFGWREGRDPSPWFDTTAYLAAYPDVAAAGVDPLRHFLAFGVHEGRLPFADGVWG